MIYISTEYLKPGMILARDIFSGDSNMFALLSSGQELSPALIRRLEISNIPGVYVKGGYDGDDDAAPVELFEPGYKKQVIDDIKKVYADGQKNKSLSAMAVQKSLKLAQDIVMNMLNRDIFLLDVVVIKNQLDPTFNHSLYVATHCVLTGLQLKYSQSKLNDLALCGLLHDMGKLDIPNAILNKPGKLTTEEFAVIKKHPACSVERLKANRNISYQVLNAIACHHERVDGSGYPHGLKGGDIHDYAKIVALADVYDALTSERPWRKAWTSAKAIDYMISMSDSHFDRDMLNEFIKTVTAYPTGTVVRLSNGIVGLVIKNNPENTLRPVIRILNSAAGATPGKALDLMRDAAYLNVVVTESVANESGGDLPDDVLKKISVSN